MDHTVTGLLVEAFFFLVPYAYSGMLETFILSEQWSISNKYIHNRKKRTLSTYLREVRIVKCCYALTFLSWVFSFLTMKETSVKSFVASGELCSRRMSGGVLRFADVRWLMLPVGNDLVLCQLHRLLPARARPVAADLKQVSNPGPFSSTLRALLFSR